MTRAYAESGHNDWNGKLSVANAVGQPYPLDREFWAVTSDALAVRVRYWPEWTAWACTPYFALVDSDGETIDADEMMGWTDSQEDAEEAAALLMEFGQ